MKSKNPELWKEHTSIVNRAIDQIDERLLTGGGNDVIYKLRVSVREFPTKEVYYIRHFGNRHYARLGGDIEQSLTSLSLMATRKELWSSGTLLMGIPRYSFMNIPSLQIG